MKGCGRKDQSLKFYAEKNAKRCCVVRANISFLQFPPGDDPRKVQHLTRVFKQQGCDRANERHAIPGTVTEKELQDALAYSNLSLNDLRFSHRPPFLNFPPGTFIRCAQGRSRIAALTQTSPMGDRWWPVELFIDLSAGAFEALTEAFENETSPSDGYICWKIYESYCRDKESENRWWVRLSKRKADTFRSLLRHEYLTQDFMLVLQIPGMRDGLQLGSIMEVLSSKMDEVGHYLRHTYATCVYVAGSCECLKFMDTTTVEVLESRAPGQSQKDYDYISQAMEYGVIFKGICEEPKRREILGRLQQLKGLFTTFHTLQQDCKYISRCGRVLRTLALGDCEVQKKMIHKQTVQRIMATTFTPILDPWEPANSFENNLKLLYLHIMRDLEALSGEHCLLEDGEKAKAPLTRNHPCWFELAKQAKALSFESENIRMLAMSDPHFSMAKEMLELTGFQYSELKLEGHIRTIANILAEAQAKDIYQRSPHLTSDIGEEVKRRCGRQYTNAYNSDRFHYTASIINQRHISKGSDITSLFVWKSTFHAFWGYDKVEVGLEVELADPSHENTQRIDCDIADVDMAEPTPLYLRGLGVNAGNTVLGETEDRELTSEQQHTDIDMADSTEQRPRMPATRGVVPSRMSKNLLKITKPSTGVRRDVSQPRLQRSIKSSATTLLGPSISKVLGQSVNPSEHKDEDIVEIARNAKTASNMTVTSRAQSIISACKQVSRNEVRIYYLKDDTNWELVGSHSRESVGQAVRTLLRENGNMYLFDSEERGLHPRDCGKVSDPVVCITLDWKGFGRASPPEEVEL